MSVAIALLDWRSATLRALAFCAAAWRDVTRRQIGATLLFGIAVMVAFLMISPSGIIDYIAYPSTAARALAGFELRAFALFLAIVVADRAVPAGTSRPAAYALAAVIGCCIGMGLDWLTRLIFWGSFFPLHLLPPGESPPPPLMPFYLLFDWLLLGGVATFVYADRRRSLATAHNLRAAEIARVSTTKRVLESRLQAMQARVEPAFLFNTLAQVKRLYKLDAAAGGQMMDDLIAYLRAAMPQMRDTSSTLAQELELARAYLAIVKVRLGDRLCFAIDVPQDIGDSRMPPMMLLPLIDHAVVHGLEPSDINGSITIGAVVADGKLKLTVQDSGAGFIPRGPGDDALEGIRERLVALYGADARLELQCNEQCGTQALMEIPHERTESGNS